MICQVALNIPFASFLDYLPPKDCQQVAIGSRVLVSLGNSRKLVGVVVGMTESSRHSKLKTIDKILDEQPLFEQKMLDFLQQTAKYYQAGLGEVIAAALPRWLRQIHNRPIPKKYWWKTTASITAAKAALSKAPAQQKVFNHLHRYQPLQSAEMTEVHATASQVLKQLQKKGLVASSELCFLETQQPQTVDFQLTEDQQTAISQIQQHGNQYQTFLLDGITGSGKTEVYIRLIQKIISQGRQALVLVPEIGLTPQLFQQIGRRLQGRIAVLHSGLADGTRARVWQQAAQGQVAVVVATRSGIYTPFQDLGLIVVDEEHDLSYKQQDSFRYSARDLASLRGKIANIPVLLGSATPALETLNHAINNRFIWLKLRTRTNQKPLPKITLQNIILPQQKQGLSPMVRQQMQQHLQRGNQVLLFLNRRGWSPKLICQDCGWVAQCDDCDAYLTYHRQIDLLKCHHCERIYSIPEFCPDCGSQQLLQLGFGTEQIEAAVSQQTTDFPVLRFDRDTVKTPAHWHANLKQISSGQPCVIIGTQMLAKGHDFPRLSLVVVVNVDASFFSTDFRATEHLAQLLIQVSGRAGRADTPGEVIIQTQHPDHEFFKLLLSQGYETFAKQQLQQRQQLLFPPYSHMAIIRAQHRDENKLTAFLEQMAELGEQHPNLSILGPIPAPIQRKQGLHRMQLIINANHRKALHQYLFQLKQQHQSAPVQWLTDIDPINFDG